ncbi:DNA-dependent ATPase fun30 [Rhizina undulata]
MTSSRLVRPLSSHADSEVAASKRRKIAHLPGGISDDDSTQEFTADVATLPLSSSYFSNGKGKIKMIDLASSPPPDSQITQPTQILPASPDCDPLPTSREPPVVQVQASSPFRQPVSSPPRPLSAVKSTPSAVKEDGSIKPFDFYPSRRNNKAIDLTDDDLQFIGLSSDEGSDNDIKPTFSNNSLKKSIPSVSAMKSKRETISIAADKVEETPVSKLNLARFAYSGARLDSITRKPNASISGGLAASYASRPRLQRHPERAQPLFDIRLQDIQNEEHRTQVARMKLVLPNKPNQVLLDAYRRKGNFDDAMDYLTNDDAPLDPLSPEQPKKSEPRKGVAQARPAVANSKATANRAVRAPRVAIKDKWSSTQAQAIELSSPIQEKKSKRRLIRGSNRNSRKLSSSPPAHIIVDDDSDSEAQSNEESEDDTETEVKLLKYINECTVKELSDIASTTEEIAKTIISQRPFKSLDAVRQVSSDVNSKTKKGKGARARAIGDKVVDICLETWKGYEAVDSLIARVEELGKPIAESIKKWGVDIFGAAGNGELDITDINGNGNVEAKADSIKDSAIGTPTDGGSSDIVEDGDDIKSHRRDAMGSFFKNQPAKLGEGVVLKDYQLVGVNWLSLLYEKGLSCILADEMGLGKTCQVISFLAHLLEKGIEGPHLVVVPSSTLENWLREFQRFCPKLKVEPYYGQQKERVGIRMALFKDRSWNVLVTTYQLATGDKLDKKFLKELSFNVCVYDEGHLLKNSSSNRYDALMRLPAKFRLLLTGTPLQNNLQELASLLAFILPNVFNEKREDLASIFKYKAKTTDDEESNSALLSQQRIKRARAMMTPFVLRRKKQQVLKHLPAKTSRVEYCSLNETQSEIYNKHITSAQEALAARTEGKKANKTTSNLMMQLRKASIHPLLFRHHYTDGVIRKMAKDIMKEDEYRNNDQIAILEDMEVMNDFELNRLCGNFPKTLKKYALDAERFLASGKVKTLRSMLAVMKKKGDRVLLFSQFTQVLDILELVLEGMDLPFLRIDGSTPVDARQDLIDQYHEEEDIMVFLLSTKAGGFGINLACANKVVIFDSSFNPHDDAQASDRAHRVGQKREVEVIRLVTKGTIEEQILALANTKLALDQSISEGDDKAIEGKAEELVAKMLLESKIQK